jgi:hypothetical protein
MWAGDRAGLKTHSDTDQDERPPDSIRTWKTDLEARTALWAVDGHGRSSVGTNQHLGHTQAQAGSPALGARREEGLEDLFQMLFQNSRPSSSTMRIPSLSDWHSG